MQTENYIYHDDQDSLCGYLAYQKKQEGKRPAVIVVHDWSGRNSFACEKAQMLAGLGYLGFACDMYGSARVGHSIEEKKALMHPLIEDRGFLRQRIQAALTAVLSFPQVDPKRVAVMGFCFGGLCALDLARSGAEICGAVSFHGILSKPEGLEHADIKAKILVLHGYDDPMVKPQDLEDFCAEMTEAKVDWQAHLYGLTQHAFTNPLATDANLGLIYSPKAERRAFAAMKNFFAEIFSA